MKLNAEHEYLDLLAIILDRGKNHNDRTGVGTTSIFGYQFRHNMAVGFPLLTTKRLSFRWIAEELFWFLSGSTNVEHLRERCDPPITIWDAWATKEQCAKFGREEGDLGPIYGHQWRNYGASKRSNRYSRVKETSQIYHTIQRKWVHRDYLYDGIDQIKVLMDNLESNPNSRRLIVNGWNPAEADQVALPPCHTLFQFKYWEEKNTLDLQMYQRSADVFLGVPYNIASYALLLEIVCACAGMKPGEYVHTFGDVHIYNNHQDQVKEQLSRVPRELPKLEFDVERDCRSAFDQLMDYKFEFLNLENYNPHPSIKADVAV